MVLAGRTSLTSLGDHRHTQHRLLARTRCRHPRIRLLARVSSHPPMHLLARMSGRLPTLHSEAMRAMMQMTSP